MSCKLTDTERADQLARDAAYYRHLAAVYSARKIGARGAHYLNKAMRLEQEVARLRSSVE